MNQWLNFYEMDNSSVLSRIENFVPYHEKLGSILLNDSLLDIVSELMGEQAVLYKDRFNFKPPGGGAHAAHQDGVAYESSALEKFNSDNPNFSKITQQIEDELSWKQIETDPRDVILFTERLPHRSKTNRTDKSRRILYGVYNPLSEGDKRTTYFDDKRKNINDARYMVGNPHAPVK
ncbi:MAG: phytanoyl-CoA dioxygenase family protein [Balneola sp.]